MNRSRRRKSSRRAFIGSALAAFPAGALLDALLEPSWISIRRLSFAGRGPTRRVAHITDLHYRGSKRFLRRVVAMVNDLAPDVTCFTGDLVEENRHVPAALEILSGLRSPLVGVPGNHDYWANISFDAVNRALESTGGAWLMDQQVAAAQGNLVITGASCEKANIPIPDPIPGKKNILLIHYPPWVEKVRTRFDVILSGHSHGGQADLPFYGPVIQPFSVGPYHRGLYHTVAGPLYVNPGLGWFELPLRFNCRPEITLIEL